MVEQIRRAMPSRSASLAIALASLMFAGIAAWVGMSERVSVLEADNATAKEDRAYLRSRIDAIYRATVSEAGR